MSPRASSGGFVGLASGRRATIAMRTVVLGKRLRCELDGSSTYDRCAGVCCLNGRDIGEHLIRAGLARDRPRYSVGRVPRSKFDETSPCAW